MLSRWSFRINTRDKYHNDRKRNACENIPIRETSSPPINEHIFP